MASADITTAPTSPATFEVDTTVHSITLDPDRAHTFQWTGLTAAGAVSAAVAYLSTAASYTGSLAAHEAGKFALKAFLPATVPPGVSKVYFKTAANSVVVQVEPSAKYLGQR